MAQEGRLPMRFSGYRQNPLECSEILGVEPTPPGPRVGGGDQEVLVTEIAGTALVQALSFNVLTSSGGRCESPFKDASAAGQHNG